MRRGTWSPEDEFILRKLYPSTPNRELCELLDRDHLSIRNKAVKLGLAKDQAYMDALPTRIQPGSVPANKGMRRPGWAPGRMAQTQFKKGQLSGVAAHNYVPVGTEKVRDGYLCRKVTDDPNVYPAARWVGVHRLVWEAANGPIPAGHSVVFKPRRATTEREAITPDAVELVTRAELMRRNSYHTRYPPEVRGLIQLRGALNRKINNRSKKREEQGLGRA